MKVIQNQFHVNNTCSATRIKEISLVCGNMQYIKENLGKTDFKVIQYGCLPGKNSRKNIQLIFAQLFIQFIFMQQLNYVADIWFGML